MGPVGLVRLGRTLPQVVAFLALFPVVVRVDGDEERVRAFGEGQQDYGCAWAQNPVDVVDGGAVVSAMEDGAERDDQRRCRGGFGRSIAPKAVVGHVPLGLGLDESDLQEVQHDVGGIVAADTHVLVDPIIGDSSVEGDGTQGQELGVSRLMVTSS